jgi:plasmid stability protein
MILPKAQSWLHSAANFAIVSGKGNNAMNTLHVRSVANDLYSRLQQLADARNRSLSAQVITMLVQALEDEKRRKSQIEILSSIQRRRFKARKMSEVILRCVLDTSVGIKLFVEEEFSDKVQILFSKLAEDSQAEIHCQTCFMSNAPTYFLNIRGDTNVQLKIRWLILKI